MSALLKLSALAVKGMVFGACQALGLEAGDKAVEPVTRFLGDRFGQEADKLVRVLTKVNARAWDTLEIALAGESLWQRCTALFGRAQEQAFRREVRAFLDGLPAGLLEAEGPEFRKLALAELRLARREGALRVCALDVQQLAHRAGRLAAFASPEALLAEEQRALSEIAESFPGERYANLRRLLTLTPPGGTPLLTAAARFFLRREIEADRTLFQNLAFAMLEHQGDALESGLRHLEELLENHAGRMEQLVAQVAHLSILTHDEVLKISAKLDQLLERHQLIGRELRPDDTLLPISQEEHRLARDLVTSYRALPEAERTARVEMVYKIGQAEALSGDFVAAQEDFQAAARLLPEPPLQAEAHASAFQAALARRDFEPALASLTAAARMDPARFAPFPLDKYVPRRILGAGGFGAAVLCEHAFQRTNVVVKSLWTTGLDRAVDDVFHEAQVLAGLRHPAIVPVLDCDYGDRERRRRPYIVMDYFDGVSLAAHAAANGVLDPAAFHGIARQVAEGLQAAHERGVYHRDVKPANVLVSFSREPSASASAKLIDFGLALRPATLAVSRLTTDGHDTVVGASIAGTWKYAAPEQLGELPGVAVGPCSDVYAFGRTCYFALLGTPEPDDGEKEQLPEPWRRLLSRCTARLPARRPAGFAEVLQELDRMISPAQPHPKPVEPPRPARPQRPPRTRPMGTVRATCIRPISAHEGTVSAVTFRPDGRLLATGGFDDRVRLWSLPSGLLLDGFDAHGADVNGVAFSPDGGQMATAGDDCEVRLWSVPQGKRMGTLRHPERVYGVAYSPDGAFLATGCDDCKVRMWTAAAPGAPRVTLSGHTGVVRHVAFSPDGRWLASASGDRLVHLWATHDGTRRLPLVGHTHAVWGVAFSLDGRLVATASQDRTARVWQVSDGHPLLTLDGHADTVWCVAFTPDGRVVATGSHDRTVKLWCAASGRLLTTLNGHTGIVRSLAFSPDGRTLATASGDGTVRLWLLHDDTERCDWSAGVPALPPRPKVAVTCAGNGIVYPGDELWLDIEVENAGRGDLVQLRAQVESPAPLLRGLSAFFGRVKPGEKAHRCVSVPVPGDLRPCELRGELVFHEGNEYPPATVPLPIRVHGLPREDFVVKWRLVDDGSGNSCGDGDGVPQRGECIDVAVTVENQTGDALEGLLLSLAAVDVPLGVVVNVPAQELPAAAHGGRVEGRVTFSVKPAAKTGTARFELRVETPEGRVFAREEVVAVIE